MNTADVIKFGWPTAEFSISDDDYTTLNWISQDVPKPALADIENLENAYLQQRKIAMYTKSIENLLEATSQEKQYKNQYSIVSYANSTNAQWNAEANAFIAWRDAVYLASYTLMASVEAGQKEAPSIEDFIAGLPGIKW